MAVGVRPGDARRAARGQKAKARHADALIVFAVRILDVGGIQHGRKAAALHVKLAHEQRAARRRLLAGDGKRIRAGGVRQPQERQFRRKLQAPQRVEVESGGRVSQQEVKQRPGRPAGDELGHHHFRRVLQRRQAEIGQQAKQEDGRYGTQPRRRDAQQPQEHRPAATGQRVVEAAAIAVDERAPIPDGEPRPALRRRRGN